MTNILDMAAHGVGLTKKPGNQSIELTGISSILSCIRWTKSKFWRSTFAYVAWPICERDITQ